MSDTEKAGLDHTRPFRISEMLELLEATDAWHVKKQLIAAENEPEGFLAKAKVKESPYYIPNLSSGGPPGSAFSGVSERLFRTRMLPVESPEKPNPTLHLFDWYRAVCEERGIDISEDKATPSEDKAEDKADDKTDDKVVEAPKKRRGRPPKVKAETDDKTADETDDKVEVKADDSFDLKGYLDREFGEVKKHVTREAGNVTTFVAADGESTRVHVTKEAEALRLEHERTHAALVYMTSGLLGPDAEKEVGGILKQGRKILRASLDSFDVKNSPLK